MSAHMLQLPLGLGAVLDLELVFLKVKQLHQGPGCSRDLSYCVLIPVRAG